MKDIIETSVQVQDSYPSFVNRYFTKGFRVNLPLSGPLDQTRQASNSNDVCILRHSNRICLVTLAPSHPILAEKKKVTSVSFKVTEKVDRSLNKVSGKRKRGAQWLDASSPLCKVKCDDESEYTIFCGMRGSLVEMNSRLLTNPELLFAGANGFVAIVMPKLQEADCMMEKLMNQQQFDDYSQLTLQ